MQEESVKNCESETLKRDQGKYALIFYTVFHFQTYYYFTVMDFIINNKKRKLCLIKLK